MAEEDVPFTTTFAELTNDFEQTLQKTISRVSRAERQLNITFISESHDNRHPLIKEYYFVLNNLYKYLDLCSMFGLDDLVSCTSNIISGTIKLLELATVCERPDEETVDLLFSPIEDHILKLEQLDAGLRNGDDSFQNIYNLCTLVSSSFYWPVKGSDVVIEAIKLGEDFLEDQNITR
eukprot:TRINITY_DN575_c0_g1_i1.p1 TRINITY_DN575_c0_g1~~TRINITY_DN575_c0_g1_i1.p1  ORF type:complete len:178 (-),score=45.06 TRINITY_DN575_c0_g1_i1:699-1232(-)